MIESEEEEFEMEFGDCDEDENHLPPLEDDQTSYSFCYQHAKSTPKFLFDHKKQLKHLDLSHNVFHSLIELHQFRSLEHLVLDNNMIDDETIFPRLPKLETLQLNHNNISKLVPFIRNISSAFPRLKCLSLLGNEACPGGSSLTGLLKKEEKRDHQLYRCYTASRIKSLIFLDWTAISDVERLKGDSIYRWSDFLPGALSNEELSSSVVRVEDSSGKTSKASRVVYRYNGNRSEGNRFIKNDDL